MTDEAGKIYPPVPYSDEASIPGEQPSEEFEPENLPRIRKSSHIRIPVEEKNGNIHGLDIRTHRENGTFKSREEIADDAVEAFYNRYPDADELFEEIIRDYISELKW